MKIRKESPQRLDSIPLNLKRSNHDFKIKSNVGKLETIIKTYDDSISDIIDKFTALLNEMQAEAQNKSDKPKTVASFFNEFKTNKYNLENELSLFKNKQKKKMDEILNSIKTSNLNSSNTLVKSKRKFNKYSSHLEKICEQQKNEIDKLNSELMMEKRKQVKASKKNIMRNSIEFITEIDTSVSKLKTLNLPEKLDINGDLELDNIGGSEEDLQDMLDNLDKGDIKRNTTSFSPRKRIYSKPEKTTRRSFLERRQNSIVSRNNRSRSIYGDKSFKMEDDDLLSLKSDISRNKQEMAMLNREIKILRKEAMRRNKEMENMKSKHEDDLKKEKYRTDNVIKNLQSNIEEKDRELSQISVSMNEGNRNGRELKAINSLKLGLDNLIKEKKNLKKIIESLEKENKHLHKQIESLKESITKFEADFKEMEEINEKLTEKMIITVQRESKLSEKLHKLSTKLKAYDKFFNNQQNGSE